MKNATITFKIFKAILLAGFVLAATSCHDLFFDCHEGNGQLGTQERSDVLFDFNSISLSASFDVEIAQNSNETSKSVIVEGDENLLEYIETRVQNSTLHLSLRDDDCIDQVTPMIVRIVNTEIVQIESMSSGSITVKDELYIKSGKELEIKSSGSGNITIENLACSGTLICKNSGSGNIKIQDTYARHAEINISGSGDVIAGSTRINNCNIKSSGSGNTYLKIEDYLETNITGSGDVYYQTQSNPTVKNNGSKPAIKE